MILNKCQEVFDSSTNESICDLFICSSGYEERARYIAEILEPQYVSKKVVFAFKDKEKELARSKNDLYFKKNNFDIIHCDGDSEETIFSFLDTFLHSTTKDEINIIVDYSSMTRVWYSSILLYFSNLSDSPKKVKIVFAYALSKYTPSSNKRTFNIHIGPLEGFSTISVPQKPTALIIGLGYEEHRTMGLAEYFDGETFLFYTDGTTEPAYSKEVEDNNREIISSIGVENIYKYPIANMSYTYKILYSLCKDLQLNYRIILAPCGPKPFTLITLLVALSLDSIDVWRISSGKEAIASNKVPNGEVLYYQVEFASDL